MKASFSPLHLKAFQVLDFHTSTIANQELENGKEVDIDSRSVEINYDLIPHDMGFVVTMSMEINEEQGLGYHLQITAVGHYFLDQKKMPKDDKAKSNLIHISSTNMMISNIRGYLRNVTSYGFYGAYLLPSIDINNLLNQKIEEHKKVTTKTKNKITSKKPRSTKA